MENAGGVGVAHRSEVGVEAIFRPLQIHFGKSHADKSGVPRVQGIPVAAGGIVADKSPAAVDGPDDVGQRHGGHDSLRGEKHLALPVAGRNI